MLDPAFVPDMFACLEWLRVIHDPERDIKIAGELKTYGRATIPAKTTFAFGAGLVMA